MSSQRGKNKLEAVVKPIHFRNQISFSYWYEPMPYKRVAQQPCHIPQPYQTFHFSFSSSLKLRCKSGHEKKKALWLHIASLEMAIEMCDLEICLREKLTSSSFTTDWPKAVLRDHGFANTTERFCDSHCSVLTSYGWEEWAVTPVPRHLLPCFSNTVPNVKLGPSFHNLGLIQFARVELLPVLYPGPTPRWEFCFL